MPVIGLKFESFEGKRTRESVNEQVKINSSPTIKEIKEITVPNLDRKALSFYFEFSTTYEPQLGDIKVMGEVFFVGENNSKILSEWKKKKSLPADISTDILNFLFRRCLLKIATIAEDLQLPPPVGFPKVKPTEPQSQASDYVA